MTIDLNIIATTVLSGLVLWVLNRVTATRDQLSHQMSGIKDQIATQNGRVGKLEAINVEREKMLLEHAERMRGDLAKVEGKFEASHEHFDHEIHAMRERQHEYPNHVNAEMLKVHVKLAKIEQRLQLTEETQ